MSSALASRGDAERPRSSRGSRPPSGLGSRRSRDDDLRRAQHAVADARSPSGRRRRPCRSGRRRSRARRPPRGARGRTARPTAPMRWTPWRARIASICSSTARRPSRERALRRPASQRALDAVDRLEPVAQQRVARSPRRGARPRGRSACGSCRGRRARACSGPPSCASCSALLELGAPALPARSPPPALAARSARRHSRGELGIDDLLVVGAPPSPRRRRRCRGRRPRPPAPRRAGSAWTICCEVGDQRAHAVEAGLLLDRLARVGDQLLGARLLVDGQPVLQLADELLGPVGERVELVAGVDLLAPAPVLAGVLLGLARPCARPRSGRGSCSRRS